MTRHGAQPRRQHLARGLTLLEMLVTLVIVSFVAAILSQAMGQLVRIERLLESGQLRSTAESLRAEWVRAALNGLMPGTTPAERLNGSERELQGWSSEVPLWPAPGLARLHLRMTTDERSDQTSLELVPETADGSTPVVLLRWPGREGRFMYLDAQNRWGDRWPPLTTAEIVAGSTVPVTMPRAVALDTGAAGAGFLLAVPLASPLPLPTRSALEAM